MVFTESIITKLKNLNNVIVYGKETQDVVANEFLQAEYFFYPTHFSETFSNSSAEAQLYNTVCIYNNDAFDAFDASSSSYCLLIALYAFDAFDASSSSYSPSIALYISSEWELLVKYLYASIHNAINPIVENITLLNIPLSPNSYLLFLHHYYLYYHLSL